MQRFEILDGGILLYDPSFYPPTQANALFDTLRTECAWKQEQGRGYPFPRLTAWYADPGVSYAYSGVLHHPLPWTPALQTVRERLQGAAPAPYNSVLLNLYRDGRDSMGYHADDEPELGHDPIIGSISLGAERTFHLKHNTSGERLTFQLAHGSLLVMAGTTQRYWKHAVPKTQKIVGERINLTFRTTYPVTGGPAG